MGEKPLSIDEAPAKMGTIAGGAPLGGIDVPPPAMAAGSINTTRDNIKNSGSAAAASQLPKGLEPTPTRPGDPFPDKPGPAGMAIKEQGIKVDGGAARVEGAGQTAEPVAMEGEPIPGIDVKLGKNPGGAAPTTGAVKPEPTRPGDPPPFDNDTRPPGDIDQPGGVAEGEPESVTIKGSDGSTLTLTQLETDVNEFKRVEEEDIDPDWSKKKL